MSTGNNREGRRDSEERTIKAAGRIVKYSRELYNLESVEEVANFTLEAIPRLVDGNPSASVIEIRPDGVQVLASTLPGISTGDDPVSLVEFAYERDTVVVCADHGTRVTYEAEGVAVVDPERFQHRHGGVTVVAPTVYRDEVGETGGALAVNWTGLGSVEQHHIKPVDYFAEHVATALTSIRSREQLERARNDLAKRKEMVEIYDRLLRHDLGNDLQVITGFSDAVRSMVEDDQTEEYVGKIQQTAKGAAQLIDDVGDTVKTLKKEGEPEVKHVEPILSRVVEDVTAKFDEISIEYDPDGFDYQVYAGDLLDSVFTNILSNAAIHNDGAVSVRLQAEEPTPGEVVVAIADDGSGVADVVRDDIFEMGKKGPDSNGTGFGLGLARSLVESYGGTIELGDSSLGGAEFRVTLERV